MKKNHLRDLLDIAMLLGFINNMLQSRDLFIILAILLEFCILFNASQPTSKPTTNKIRRSDDYLDLRKSKMKNE